MIDSVSVSWALTVIFATAGLLFVVGRAGRRSATVSERMSGGLHVAGSVAMIVMAWSWGARLPVWPQVVAFTVAASWFGARVVRVRLGRTPPSDLWWHDFHHAAMAAGLAWSLAVMPDSSSRGGTGDVHAQRGMMVMPDYHQMPHSGGMTSSAQGSAAGAGTAVTAVALTVYFFVAAWPWLSTAMRAARDSRGIGRQGRRHAVEAVSHAVMSMGMAAMVMLMA